jgi:hypothetical protein
LFNLYAFTYTDSFQKTIGPSSSNYADALNPNFIVPSLNLINVEVKNFLADYDSLVHVETDNYLMRTDRFGQKSMLQFGNFNVTANVTISDSNFFDCSFSKGMIYSPSF